MKLLCFGAASLRGVVGLGLLGLGAGCSDIDVAEQDLALRYFEEGDRIELEIDLRGIVGTPSRGGKTEDEVVPKAKARLEQMAAGARSHESGESQPTNSHDDALRRARRHHILLEHEIVAAAIVGGARRRLGLLERQRVVRVVPTSRSIA